MSDAAGEAEHHGLTLRRPIDGKLAYRNTRFLRADMSRLRDTASWVSFSGCEFVDCDFTESDLQGVRLCGPIREPRPASSFRGCRFDRADLRNAYLHGGLFENCSFEDTNLNGLHFRSNDLIGNRFAGVVQGLTIWGREPVGPNRPPPGANLIHGNDFRQADLRGLGLQGGVRVHDQLWPESEDVLIIDDLTYRAETAIEKLMRDPNTTPISYPVASLRYLIQTEQSSAVLRRHDPDLSPKYDQVIDALLDVPAR